MGPPFPPPPHLAGAPEIERLLLWLHTLVLPFTMITFSAVVSLTGRVIEWDVPLHIEHFINRFTGLHMMIIVCSFLFPIALQARPLEPHPNPFLEGVWGWGSLNLTLNQSFVSSPPAPPRPRERLMSNPPPPPPPPAKTRAPTSARRGTRWPRRSSESSTRSS